ncbi:uncharacterized protein LOC115706141 [Cannabis sativa]|uniref:Enhancer of polycomb-like protein n=1 Tax=Cannabis sativa TaxID=3483 RepID=A0A7J6I180_CANSA|nr:uncharacterized protein LOC115706141 [Cannabis sativa]XP_060963765.1 uncharacterized protein LOC115706141 [Cannabis sativa]KAF4367962.1 hypothetical protein F8388_002573 [Cannabis sativa]KAF4401273.1 hypothetical protein G4B88_014114 [Cannabis sativa]
MRSVRAELLGSGWFGSVHASEFEAELTRRSTRRLSESSDRVVSPRVKALGSLGPAAMPSVGMRRTTRVFGVVKGADGARVLRSGRRLSAESGETKLRRHNDGDDWFNVVKSNGGKGGGGGGLSYSWSDNDKPMRSPTAAEFEAPKKPPKESSVAALAKVHDTDKMYGIVYTRKRKKSCESRAISEVSCDGRFGRLFKRRQRRKLNCGVSSDVVAGHSDGREVINVAVASSLDRNLCAVRFLYSVLVYMTRARLRLTDLFEFLISEPLRSVHTSSGMTTSLEHPSTEHFASCKIFGSIQFQPLFCVDFSAIPHCFIFMHSCMFFRHNQPSFVRNDAILDGDDSMSDDDENTNILESAAIFRPELSHTDNRWLSHPSVKASKLASRSTQYRGGLISRKRRSSLRRARARNPSLNSVQNFNGVLVSDLGIFRKNQVPSVGSNNKIRRSLRNNRSGGSLKELNSTKAVLTKSTDAVSCSANLLVIESDKCYREEGVYISLEMSSLGEWLIAVKKNGTTKFTLKADKIMRPNSFNRFTHAITWTVDNAWKLEFPDKMDWLVYKDLYKQCSDRNVSSTGVKNIPIPGVKDVSLDWDGRSAPFCRPNSYISVRDNEVKRALANKNANYDMDLEDEAWLKKLNSDNGIPELVSEDIFESLFDTLEIAYFYNEVDITTDINLAIRLCQNLGGREVVVAVYEYWLEKRKQNKASSLLRVFQGNEMKRASTTIKTSYRRKRSFKRQPSQLGRGKQSSFLFHAMVSEIGSVDEQNASLTKAQISAKRCMESAVCKRRRAQMLMNNADLATYKATMARRIAEAMALYPNCASASAYFLD